MTARKRVAHPPVWTLEHGITQSFIDAFLTCREQCRLRYVEGWRKTTLSKPLLDGNIGHYVLERAYHAAMRGVLTQRPSDAWVKKICWKYRNKLLEQRPLSGEQTGILDEAVYMHIHTLPYYFRHWEEDFTFQWTSLEEEFSVPYSLLGLPNIKTNIVTRFRGKFDGVFTRKGKLWLLENKFKSIIDQNGITDTLHTDLQCLFYLNALRLSTGICPEGVIYNVIRRPQLRPRNGEKYLDFIARLQADIEDRPDFYFFRVELQMSEEELVHWWDTDLHNIMRQIWSWSKGEHYTHYLTPGALFNKYGRAEHFDIITKGDYSQFERVQAPFSELENDL